MKKLLFVLAIGVFAACGNGSTESTASDSTLTDSTAIAPADSAVTTDTTIAPATDSSAAPAPADSAK